jgi:hypothetical protein
MGFKTTKRNRDYSVHEAAPENLLSTLCSFLSSHLAQFFSFLWKVVTFPFNALNVGPMSKRLINGGISLLRSTRYYTNILLDPPYRITRSFMRYSFQFVQNMSKTLWNSTNSILFQPITRNIFKPVVYRCSMFYTSMSELIDCIAVQPCNTLFSSATKFINNAINPVCVASRRLVTAFVSKVSSILSALASTIKRYWKSTLGRLLHSLWSTISPLLKSLCDTISTRAGRFVKDLVRVFSERLRALIDTTYNFVTPKLQAVYRSAIDYFCRPIWERILSPASSCMFDLFAFAWRQLVWLVTSLASYIAAKRLAYRRKHRQGLSQQVIIRDELVMKLFHGD